MTKTPTDWSANPSAETALKTYDNALTTYDSATTTYDSIVIGDEADTEKAVTVWVAA